MIPYMAVEGYGRTRDAVRVCTDGSELPNGFGKFWTKLRLLWPWSGGTSGRALVRNRGVAISLQTRNYW